MHIIEYRRNRRGEFVAGYRQTLRALGIIAISISLMGGIAHFAQRSMPILPGHEANAASLPEGCQRTDKGLACDFTDQETIDNLRKHVPMRDIPEEVTSTSTDMATMEALIRRIAWEEGLDTKMTDHAIAIATCESRLNPYRTNGNGNKPAGSVDRGLWQWNSWHQRGVSDACAFDPECSTREALKRIKAGKAHLWVCDGIVKKGKK